MSINVNDYLKPGTCFPSVKIPGYSNETASASKAEEEKNQKKILCKYRVNSLIIMKGDENIVMDHSNILSIEYLNDYEFNIMALLKISLRIDLRKKLWILKNKREILIKFELNKVGMDSEIEKYITAEEEVWNLEFGAYFNDEDESADTEVMEDRIKLNEGKEFQSNNIQEENYFETQNVLDMYLFPPKLLKASRYSFNKVYTENTLQNFVGQMLTESKHNNVLMSKFENDDIFKELLLPVNPVYKNLIYLDQYFGFYKKGAIIYYDIDTLYIINANGKVTAKREGEWTETTFLVTKIANSTPGHGMVRKEGEEIFYPTISEMDINPQKFSISKNVQLGSEAKMVVTDDITIDIQEAEQSYIDERNEKVTFIKKKNKYTGSVIKSRMEENECVLYISGDNLDINAFTPNKTFQVIFDEPLKHETYGKNKYRLTYAYHYIKLESEGFMSSSHRIILKKTEGSSSNNSSNIINNALGVIAGFNITNIKDTIKAIGQQELEKLKEKGKEKIKQRLINKK